MRNRIIFSGLLIIGISQAAWSQNSNANRPGGVIEKAEEALRSATTRPANSMEADVDGVREALRQITQAALAKGGFDRITDQFSDADRARLISSQANKEHPTLDERIAQFQKDWQAKYNQEFKIKDKDAVFGLTFATITPGAFIDNARLVSEKMITDDRRESLTRNPSNRIDGGDSVSEPAHKTAAVIVAADGDLPAVEVPMARESSDQWKIDLPNTSTMTELHDTLLTRITAMNENLQRWPADVNEATRMVSHQILMAVMNVEPRGPAQRTNDRVLNPNAVR